MTDNEKKLIEALTNLLGDDTDFVEENPDEGCMCFYCGQPFSYLSGINHEKDCSYVLAKKTLDEVKNDAIIKA